MISEMANSDEIGDNVPIPTTNNTINGSNNTSDIIDPDESLIALLASTLLENEPDDISDINELAGEYSALNNAIDEINNYLDRWEARHDHLRAEIYEVLKENQEEEKQKQEISAQNSEGAHAPQETCTSSTHLEGSALEKLV